MGSYNFKDLMELHGLEAKEAANGRLYYDTTEITVATGLLKDAAELGAKVKQIPINKNGGKRYFRILDEEPEGGVKMGGKLSFEEALAIYDQKKRKSEARRAEQHREELMEKLKRIPVEQAQVEARRKVGRPAKPPVVGKKVGHYLVESGVPLPPKSAGGLMLRRPKYPFGKMKVGDSFWVGLRAGDPSDSVALLRKRLTFSVNLAEKKLKMAFMIGVEGKGFRVWRTA